MKSLIERIEELEEIDNDLSRVDYIEEIEDEWEDIASLLNDKRAKRNNCKACPKCGEMYFQEVFESDISFMLCEVCDYTEALK